MLLPFTHKLLKYSFNCCIKMSVFTQKLNPILGENTWEWQDEEYDYVQEIARSSFADMLHDTERNQKYCDALKVAINKMHAMGKKAKVLDIGTGTGLLSMMAVRCGADSVVACEAFLPIGTCAQKVISLNECDKIKIVSKHSTALTVGENGDLPERANILVTEVFDTELIGEGALTTFSHAHKELLETDCIIVPNSATVYAQVVETPLAGTWNELKDIYSPDGAQVLMRAPAAIKKCSGAAAVHDIQLSQLPNNSFTEIIPPTPVFQFDWSGKAPLIFERRNITKVTAKRDGTAQVVFMWWELGMDTENKIILSCAPYWAHPLKRGNPNLTSTDIPWRDHWMQAVYYLPKEASVKKGEELQLISCHDEFSWWFYMDANTSRAAEDYCKPVCECGFHIAHSRTRIGQINDDTRNKKYLSVLSKHVNRESVVLLVGDGFYLGLVAEKFGAKKIICLNENSLLSTITLQQLIKVNRLSNVEVVESIEDLKKNVNVKDINLVVAQPHFSTTILPWDGLHFAYLVKQLRSFVKPDAVILPAAASIKGLIVEFKDLQKIRQRLETCGEFDMKPFDDLILESSTCCDPNVEAQPLWEYPCRARSSVHEFAKLDLKTMFTSESDVKEVSGQLAFQETLKYNAIALWIDWYLDGSNENVISTGPVVPPTVGEMVQWDMHTRQGVQFLEYKTKTELFIRFNFNIKDGKINFTFC